MVPKRKITNRNVQERPEWRLSLSRLIDSERMAELDRLIAEEPEEPERVARPPVVPLAPAAPRARKVRAKRVSVRRTRLERHAEAMRAANVTTLRKRASGLAAWARRKAAW